MGPPKIVISGATGWLGQELIKVLSTKELNKAKEINNLPILITGGTGFIGSWLVTALNK